MDHGLKRKLGIPLKIDTIEVNKKFNFMELFTLKQNNIRVFIYFVYTGCFKIKYTILNQHNFHSIIDTNLKQKPFKKGGFK